MRHRRSIDLTRTPDPPYVERPQEVADLYDIAGKIQDLSSWTLIGGRCARCEREGWIDRDWLEAKSPNAVITSLSPKLRCRNAVPRAAIVGYSDDHTAEVVTIQGQISIFAPDLSRNYLARYLFLRIVKF